jgi:cell division protein FtsI/penicillin-binding protein 2
LEFKLKKIIPIVLTLITICLIIPQSWKRVDSKLQEGLKNVKYRASLIHKPLSDVLREQAYGSYAERKIIETAQNQWFIHTFLDHADQYPRRIGLQPHFRTGVDYITQTRDVVLPRYVIGEFGYLTMFFLIVLFTMPLMAYLLIFRLYNQEGQMDSESVIGLLVLTVSVLLPLSMLYILLTRRPVFLKSSQKTLLPRLLIVSFFILLIFTMVTTGGKSSLLRDNHFQPRMDDIRNRIDRQVNRLFEESQRGRKAPQKKLTADKEFFYVGAWLRDMTNLPDYKSLYDSLSKYERTMIDALVEKPSLGFDQRSPIHIIRADGFYQLHFNNWFHLELPFYESDKAWRGDVYQPVSDDGSLTRRPPDDISRYIHQLPSEYFMPGEKRFAMIDIYNIKARMRSPEILLYKPNEGVLKTLDLQGFAERIEEQDLLLYRIPNQHGINNYNRFQTWNLADGSRQYFGFNAKVNGRWRMIYPMASLFPWIREWTNAGSFHMQQRGGAWLDSSLVLNLDYDLTKSTNSYLHETLQNSPTKKDGVLISVVAADGDGRIRVMADHVIRNSRTPINPNNQGEIEQLQREQYFNRNPEAERYQWGNANLLHMRDGPGSSIKPIVFAAVSSQLNIEWEKMEYIKHSGNLIQSGTKGDFLVEHYAGMDLTKEGLKWPEPNYNNDNSNLETYIAKSRNIHHSLIVFLGSYTRKDFPGRTLRDKLRPANANTTFPVVGLGNATYALPNPPQWPMDPVSGLPFGNSNSLMAVGLSELFGLETQSSFSSGRLTERTDCSMLPDSLAYRNVWAFPERSYFDQAERTDNFSSAIIQTTLGGGIFRVTPLQMLQMYGRLFNHDQGFRLSIDSTTGNSQSWLNLNPDDWNASSFDQFLDQGRGGHKGLMESMKSVVKKGTATYIAKNQRPGFTLYAKTGTTGNAAINYSSKRLFVAIVKDASAGEPVDFKARRKYFIYMTLDRAYGRNESTWHETVFNQLIDHVMKSESFKAYMTK